MDKNEVFVSVDIETAGPIPSVYSMLSIGACLVDKPEADFYTELKPITENFDPEALAVCHFSLDDLKRTGIEPQKAMSQFDQWISGLCGEARPVFVAYGSDFDWSFINWYFHVYLGNNPFGICGLDIKSYLIGVMGYESWTETRKSRLNPRFVASNSNPHNALDDAKEQAEIFRKIRDFRRSLQLR